jgi:serine phosphatase RsbU (regulator of sigma subunit)
VKNAFAYHKLYSAMNDSVLNSENIRQMAQMKEVYESERKDNEINLLNQEQIISKKEISEQQEKIRSRNILVGASLLSILMLAGLVVVFIRSNKEKKQHNALLSQKNHLIEEKNKEIIDSINYAKRIQDSLFDNFDQVNRFFSEAMLVYLPKDIVSGDFYWCSKKIMTEKSGANSTVRELFFIAVCDSTGHGVPGGFMSLLNSAYLSEAVNEKNIYEPDKVLNYVREKLINAMSKSDQKDGFDGILMCFEKIFSFEGKELKATNLKMTYAAAHNAPLFISKGKMTVLPKNIMPVGYGERKDNFTLHEVAIEKGDNFYLYSDGYADQFGGPKGKKFMYRQLDELILKNQGLFMSQQKEELIETIKNWKGDLDQIDDILLIGIESVVS